MIKREDVTWSEPLHGVSHRYIAGRQCTVTDYGTFVDAVVFGRDVGFRLSEAVHSPAFASVEEVRRWCEQEAR